MWELHALPRLVAVSHLLERYCPNCTNPLRWISHVTELAESDPEDTFFHFARGIYRQAERNNGNTCKVRREAGATVFTLQSRLRRLYIWYRHVEKTNAHQVLNIM